MAARDVVVGMIIVFTFAIIFLVSHLVVTTITGKILLTGEMNQSTHIVKSMEGINKASARFDYIVFGIFIGISFGIIITGWFIGGNPIFMFIYMMVIMVNVAFSAILSNTWQTASTNSVFSTTLTYFPITTQLLNNLPYYAAVIGMIGLVIMFAKPNAGGDF